jgi:AcrR family transcriptional regulator
MEHTRQRILHAVSKELAAGYELTIPSVASRARVALRTVYRHFPTKDALIDAWGDWAEQNLNLLTHHYPDTLPGLLEMVPALYRSYDENEALVQALLSKPAEEVRARTRRKRLRRAQRAMDEITAELDPVARRRALAAIYLFVSAPAWQAMRTQWNLDGEEAGKAAAWAIRVLVEAVQRNPEGLLEV